jgi:hypothetical protein
MTARITFCLLGLSCLLSACTTASKRPPATPLPSAPDVGLHYCKVPKDVARPMLVEWPASEKAALQSDAKEGILIVRYDGCRLRRLSGCSLKGNYKFVETTRAREGFTVRDKNELFAKLPLGAVHLESELQHGNQLTLSYVAVGTLRSTVEHISSDMLEGNCEGATHFLHEMVVGAYTLTAESASSAKTQVGIGPAGAGGSSVSEQRVIRSGGNAHACWLDSTPADDPQCQAVIQLVLDPITYVPPDGTSTQSAAVATSVQPPTGPDTGDIDATLAQAEDIWQQDQDQRKSRTAYVQQRYNTWKKVSNIAREERLPKEQRIAALDEFVRAYPDSGYAEKAKKWRGAIAHEVPVEDYIPPEELKQHHEWFMFRAIGGVYGGGGEISAPIIRGESCYFEIIRTGVGAATYGYWANIGTSLGYMLHLDNMGRHDLRIGIGASFGILQFGEKKTIEEEDSTSSVRERAGVGALVVPEIYYVWHSKRFMALVVGLAAQVLAGPPLDHATYPPPNVMTYLGFVI